MHIIFVVTVAGVEPLIRVQLFPSPCTAAHQAFLVLTISRSLPKFIFITLVMPSNHLILWCHVLLLPSIFSGIRDFSNESAVRIRWSKYRSFSFSINSSNVYSGLISFRVGCFDLLQPKVLSRVFSNTQFKSINSLALSLLYGLTLTSIHDYWKNHSFD